MIERRHVLALLKAEPGVVEVIDDDSDEIYFVNDLPTRGDDETFHSYQSRLSSEQLSRFDSNGLSFGTYSLLVDLGCSIFGNDCEGSENEYMVCLPSSSSNKALS